MTLLADSLISDSLGIIQNHFLLKRFLIIAPMFSWKSCDTEAIYKTINFFSGSLCQVLRCAYYLKRYYLDKSRFLCCDIQSTCLPLMGEMTLNHTILVNYVFILSRWEQDSNWSCISFQYLSCWSSNAFLSLWGCLLNVLSSRSSLYIKDIDGNTILTTPFSVIWGWSSDAI